MSQIDLKHATISVRDGYSGPTGAQAALVNLMSGYSTGAVTMAVDGITGAVVTGDSFLVAGDTVLHTITAHTETSTNTTSITFTPALAADVTDDAAITWQAHELEIKIGEGNCTYDEKRNIQYQKDRGLLDTVREGDQDPVEVKIDFMWQFLRSISGATIPTPEEAFKQIGAAANWVSSSDDVCEPYAVDIIILYTPPCSTEQPEEVVLKDYRWETLNHDPKAGTVSTQGKCNVVQATVTRLAG